MKNQTTTLGRKYKKEKKAGKSEKGKNNAIKRKN
jgi:hypothetical protein